MDWEEKEQAIRNHVRELLNECGVGQETMISSVHIVAELVGTDGTKRLVNLSTESRAPWTAFGLAFAGVLHSGMKVLRAFVSGEES